MAASRQNDHAGFGERLGAARKALGLSARAAEARLRALGHDITHATILNYERGITVPNPKVMEGFCQIYGRPKDWFVNSHFPLTGTRYRALKSVTAAQRTRYEGEAWPLLVGYVQAEDALGRRSKIPRIQIDADTTGRALAERIRRRFHLAEYPIPSVVRLLENFGVHVVALGTTERIDGFAAYLGRIPVVVLNTSLPSERVRLNAAHELAHHLFSDCIRRHSVSGEEIEKRAFECASHLLLPESQLHAALELQSMVRLVQYKERFGISLAAIIYRARQSNFISSHLYTRLWKDFAKMGWRKNEPGHVAPDRPVRMETLVDAAVHQKKLTYRELGLITGLEEQLWRRRIYEAMGSVPVKEKLSGDDPQGQMIRFEDFG